MSSYDDLYLEKIKGEKALLWVKKQNERSLSDLKSHPHFKKLKSYQKSIMEAKDKLVYISLYGDKLVYNFWRDKTYKRGLLRRTSLKNYLSRNKLWEKVLDLDALAKKEKENWVYKGGVYHPEGKRVLMIFSRGGKDASVIREFDLVQKNFVKEGFYLPESYSFVSWISENEIAIATDWKTKDSLTNSHYPRIVKTLKRGDSITKALNLFKAEKTDLTIRPLNFPLKGKRNRLILIRRKDFFSNEFLLQKDNGEITKIPLPSHASLQTFFQGNFVIKLEKGWIGERQNYPAGSLLIIKPDRLIKGESLAIQLLMKSRPQRILNYARASKDSIYVNILKNVKSSIVELRLEGKVWKKRSLPLPSFSTIDIIYSNSRKSDVFFSATGFLESPTLYHYNDTSKKLTKIQELSPRFNPRPYKVEQFFAKSFDGVLIPYFVVRKKDLKKNGKNPVLLEAYGGFRKSHLPFYDPMQEFAWYKKGGVFVLANIRGGGEYGLDWHQAGLKEKRQTVFNDFYAVAEDLIQRKITSPNYLGIKGNSNGGLLMGVAITQKPNLFRAALIGNPLLDMLRYHRISIGSAWISEFGDPKDSKMQKFISSYSPYQNLKPNKSYPKVFLFTSTLDDRVHPGHARRFAHKLEKLKKPFYYYESAEGGHFSASNYEQWAILSALQYIHLYKTLMDK